jgi:hypothetical protein
MNQDRGVGCRCGDDVIPAGTPDSGAGCRGARLVRLTELDGPPFHGGGGGNASPSLRASSWWCSGLRNGLPGFFLESGRILFSCFPPLRKMAGFSLSGKGRFGGRSDAAASSDFQMGYLRIGSGLIYSTSPATGFWISNNNFN